MSIPVWLMDAVAQYGVDAVNLAAKLVESVEEHQQQTEEQRRLTADVSKLDLASDRHDDEEFGDYMRRVLGESLKRQQQRDP